MRNTIRTTVELDWTKLLGFDQAVSESAESAPYAAKIGTKQLVRRPGDLDSVAMARLTKVGLKPDQRQ